MNTLAHIPVLLDETLAHLNLKKGDRVIDCTLGLGGHSSQLLQAIGPQGKLMAFEQDEMNLKAAKKRLEKFKEQITFVSRNFEHLEEAVRRHDFKPTAILFDLGLSSPHLDEAERGFSFQKDGPLDMRFDRREKWSAADLINRTSEKELADLIWRYGEEKRSRKIARAIVEERKHQPFETTGQLAKLIEAISPGKKRGHHPATKTFQALRIAVNRELEVLEKALHGAIEILQPEGRIAVISYHSLEDRIVKQIFRHYAKNCICPNELPICQCDFQKKLYLLTKKPIIPSGIEVSSNPRSRSAKLRLAKRL